MHGVFAAWLHYKATGRQPRIIMESNELVYRAADPVCCYDENLFLPFIPSALPVALCSFIVEFKRVWLQLQ
jgi:hypothetical protein